ncbi:microcompartment protein EutL, partial [Klebsiella pneumoniae]
MKNDKLPASVFSVKVVSNVDNGLFKQLDLKPHQRSLGIITSDCDDVTYT